MTPDEQEIQSAGGAGNWVRTVWGMCDCACVVFVLRIGVDKSKACLVPCPNLGPGNIPWSKGEVHAHFVFEISVSSASHAENRVLCRLMCHEVPHGMLKTAVLIGTPLLFPLSFS